MLSALVATVASPATAPAAQRKQVALIVRTQPGAEATAAAAVATLGGKVGTPLGIINGFAATLPADALAELNATIGVTSVTPNSSMRLAHAVDGYDASADAGSLANVVKEIRAHDVWATGITGRGVDVALIDSGVVPVNGLTTPGKIINGPDLSFESQSSDMRYLDTYGHGTHMAGIIAGRDEGVASSGLTNHDTFEGVAPDARIVSIKTANAVGATDVSQIIAAIDWVIQHRNDNGMNVRVLNLAFGTDSTQDYRVDPLAYAVEVAWKKGIFVVAAAGNDGRDGAGLANPARDPYVLAVGADDLRGTMKTKDDIVPAWSSQGDGVRNPDVIGPGQSIVSLRAPHSYIDDQFPASRVGSRFTRGSGTSQATAALAGAAALLIQQRPDLTPDQLKMLLTSTAMRLPGVGPDLQGAGLININAAAAAPTPTYVQTWPSSSGTGLLEGARGGIHVVSEDGTALTGEQDIFGNAWNGTSWSRTSVEGTSWSGGTWNGTSWSGPGWSGTSWSGPAWSGTSWSSPWTGTSWSSPSLTAVWTGTSWSGPSGAATPWSGTSWSGPSSVWFGTSWSSPFTGTSWSDVVTGWSNSSWG